MIGIASAWLVLAATSPAPTPSGNFDGPSEDQFSGSGDSVSAGLYAFLIIMGLAAVTVLIVFFMNRSLKRARHNLGGGVLPRRMADQIPIRPDDEDGAAESSPPANGESEGPAPAASES